MNPIISVIVPVYNVGQYLHNCCDSILAQTFTDFELLLIDDGSTDNSGIICDEYAKRDYRVRVFHQINRGVSVARNLGIDNARGEWIAFCDGDDWIEPEMLFMLFDKAEKERADIVFADFWFEFPDSRSEGRVYDWEKQGIHGLEEYIATPWTCLWGSLQRKKLYDLTGTKSPVGINYCEDFHLITRLCYFANKITKVTKPYYHYRQQNMSIMHNLDKRTALDERLVYSDIIKFFEQHQVYAAFKKSMSWRTLKASQDLVLDFVTFDEFCYYNPEKKRYILSCPFIGKKIKTIMWMLTHYMVWGAYIIVYLRKICRR